MPRRKTPIVTNEIYHVFNRSIASVPIFQNNSDYLRMISLFNYYRFSKPPLRFSHYRHLPLKARKEYIRKLYKNGSLLIDIYSFCLMPNHLHLLLKQRSKDGISQFVGKVQNAYARYFNTKHDRSGSLFNSMFKVVRTENDEQFIHVMRYIHLNPLTSYIIKEAKDLENYKWNSFGIYIGNFSYPFVNTEFALQLFKSKEKLIEFTYNQIDYQRKLHQIKHLTLDKLNKRKMKKIKFTNKIR